MAQRKYSPAVDFGKFALCAGGAGLLASVVTGSVFPVVVVAVGVFMLFGFFSGIGSGKPARKPRGGGSKA